MDPKGPALFDEARYSGLRLRESYEQVADLVQAPPSLKEPNRRAMQLRETPQLSNLLDGDGHLTMTEMGEQQARAATHQQVEANILQAASASGAPSAQELRSVSRASSVYSAFESAFSGREEAETQTSSPSVLNTGSQVAAASTEAGTQAERAQTYSTASQAAAASAEAGTQAERAQTYSGGTLAAQGLSLTLRSEPRCLTCSPTSA